MKTSSMQMRFLLQETTEMHWKEKTTLVKKKLVQPFSVFMAVCWVVTLSEEIKTVGYDVEQIVTTAVLSPTVQQVG